MASTHFEIERRFITPPLRIPDGLRGDKIVQGYFNTPAHATVRVRRINHFRYELTKKTGQGACRRRETFPITDRFMGAELLDTCEFKLRKTVYERDCWEIHRYIGPLNGLYVLERELSSSRDQLDWPEWIDRDLTLEVTNDVTNYDLAKLVAVLHGLDDAPPVYELLVKRIPIVVLTGGPCSGKSTIVTMLRREFGDSIHCVPEAATIILSDVHITFPAGNGLLVRQFQQQLYTVQTSFEFLAGNQAKLAGRHAVVVDRGTMDNAAYMAGGEAEFAKTCRTSVDHEYGRYSAVICLAVPSRKVYERKQADNLARRETYKEAVAVGERTRAVWARHPNFHYVDNKKWDDKVQTVRNILNSVIS